MASSAPARPLGASQIASLVLIGAGLWFGAARLLAAVGPMGAFAAPGIFILYALVIPGTWPFILLARRITQGRTLLGVAIATATASLLDGNALVWMPGLYGADPAGAGAAILWGVGVALVLGLVMDKPT